MFLKNRYCLGSLKSVKNIKGPVTRCNFSCNLQCNSTLEGWKFLTNVWHAKKNIGKRWWKLVFANFTSPKNRITLQVAWKIAPCDRALSALCIGRFFPTVTFFYTPSIAMHLSGWRKRWARCALATKKAKQSLLKYVRFMDEFVQSTHFALRGSFSSVFL